MMTRIRNKRGESYIDVAVTILVVSFVLIFMVNIVSFVALNQNMKTAADRIAEYAAMNGTTDIDDFIQEQREKLGVNFTCTLAESETIDSSGKVQLGDRIECTLTYELTMGGFGRSIHVTQLIASADGISHVYWK